MGFSWQVFYSFYKATETLPLLVNRVFVWNGVIPSLPSQVSVQIAFALCTLCAILLILWPSFPILLMCFSYISSVWKLLSWGAQLLVGVFQNAQNIFLLVDSGNFCAIVWVRLHWRSVEVIFLLVDTENFGQLSVRLHWINQLLSGEIPGFISKC